MTVCLIAEIFINYVCTYAYSYLRYIHKLVYAIFYMKTSSVKIMVCTLMNSRAQNKVNVAFCYC